MCPALGIFDLAEGAEPPTAESGYAAAANAARAVGDWGRVGAGRGATVGQWRGEFLPAGIGWSAVRFRDVVVEAVVVLNAFGEPLRDLPVTSDGVFEWPDGSLLPPVKGNTTIGVVSTNAALSKVECHLVAQGAHDGLARAVTPPHTRFDGDAFIAASTGGARTRPDTDVVRAMAVAAVERAIDSVEIG
ncbi:P1 family peptidase [Salininema proteolyticum]|uniref:P1 family peptidase n=1 Tax=Salininema proteolyticum TaxID=1607685 RepID=UPI00362CF763